MGIDAELTSVASCSWELNHAALEQCWLWMQGEVRLGIGPAAWLTANDAVLSTLAGFIIMYSITRSNDW